MPTGTRSPSPLAPPTAAISAGASIAYSLTARDAYGNPWDVTGAGRYTVTPAAGGLWAASRYTACVAGIWTVIATYGALFATATLTVTPGPPTTLSIAPKAATVAAGQVQTYTAASADLCANPIGDVTAGTAFTIGPGAGGAWNGNRYTAERDGTWGVLWDTAILTVTNVLPTARAGGRMPPPRGAPSSLTGAVRATPATTSHCTSGIFTTRALSSNARLA